MAIFIGNITTKLNVNKILSHVTQGGGLRGCKNEKKYYIGRGEQGFFNVSVISMAPNTNNSAD